MANKHPPVNIHFPRPSVDREKMYLVLQRVTEVNLI